MPGFHGLADEYERSENPQPVEGKRIPDIRIAVSLGRDRNGDHSAQNLRELLLLSDVKKHRQGNDSRWWSIDYRNP
jgi:hypothetical protein